jgi:hypothetical protein
MLRRSLAALVTIAMLNVIALGSGLFTLRQAPCATGGMTAMAEGMSGMTGMEMGAPADATPEAASDHPRSEGPRGCNVPWAPGCTSAVPCGPNAAVVKLAPIAPGALPMANIDVTVYRAPVEPMIPPDLPPPRV